MNVLLIGTGRVAFHLGHALKTAGHTIVGIAGRTPERAAALAGEFKTEPFGVNAALPQADVILIAVSDDAIADVAMNIPISGAVMVHTSGASGTDKLLPHPDRAVLWPVMSLSPGDPVDFDQVPLIIDASTERALMVVKDLADSLSGHVSELDLQQRQLVHAAASISLNFPVYLLARAQELLRKNAIDPSVLTPSFLAMARKVVAIGASEALTGPARRGDIGTVQHHLDRLADDPELRAAYARISSMILWEHGHPDHGYTDL